MSNKYTRKVIKHKDKIIIFYKDKCPYCTMAIKLVKNNKCLYKKYMINDATEVIKKLSEDKTIKINLQHRTVPIIIINGKFIGGYTELKKLLN